MRTLLLDIETDGLYHEATKVHCICLAYETGPVMRFHDDPILPRAGSLTDACRLILQAERLVAHNGIGFDIPVLRKLLSLQPQGEVRDTLILSRLFWPDLKPRDWKLANKGLFPARLCGRHSLESWGHRLQVQKGDPGSHGFELLTKELLDYCARDVEVLQHLWLHLKGRKYPEQAVALEHEFADRIEAMSRRGFAFDEERGRTLARELRQKADDLDLLLDEALADFCEPQLGKDFNPQSRFHLATALQYKYGWKPKLFGNDGIIPTLDEPVLAKLNYPEARWIEERLMLTKRLGQLVDGRMGWLKLVRNGRIHGRCIHNGAVTGRCTHSQPNVAQVPAVRAPYGKECRELWTAAPGKILVGADLQGIELRILAHYLQPYDDGAFIEAVLSGDPHSANQQKLGLATRDQTKTATYATLYGAGVKKLSSALGVSLSEATEIRNKFMEGLGIDKLLADLTRAVEKKGALRGLDGRWLEVRKESAALNTLCQGGAAVVGKEWICELHRNGLDDLGLVGFIHDEIVLECKPENADRLIEHARTSAAVAGENLKLRIPVGADARKGATWAAIH